MKTKLHPFLVRPRLGQRGISLIIVLILLVVIGLTSAAAIRNATSGERATNNVRLQNLAQQYAEGALRYCEDQLRQADINAVPPGPRVASLAEVNIPTTAVGGAPAWDQAATWSGGPGGASATMTILPAAQISSADSAIVPTTLPRCVVERQLLADGNTAYVVTARGFSPGYAPINGASTTTSGSVVWLQSTIFLN
jgi:type IV pilus assembly protein PilX